MMPWFALLLFLQAPVPLDLPSISKNPHTGADDVAQGRKLYAGRCAGCHGPTGDGGKGANLALPVLSRGRTDLELYRTIRYGLAETEMPSHNMPPREIWQISAYVRTLAKMENQQAAAGGDATRGAALVRGKAGCLQCHIINGEGGLMGPSLTDVGMRRSPGYLHAKLLDPTQEMTYGFKQARLVTRDGRTLRGTCVNEDTWSIQLRTPSGALQSFQKEDLKEVVVDPHTTMPSYKGRLNDQELRDITAYLASLGGRP